MKDILIALLIVAILLSGCAPIQPESTSATQTAATETEATATTAATTDLFAPLPTDPDVRIGTLENGLTYYIRHNTEPPMNLVNTDQLMTANFVYRFK